MRNAALVLGVIGGIVGMIVGFFAYGWVEFTQWFNSEVRDMIDETASAQRWQLIGLVAPILAIAGGAMSNQRPVIGAVLMFASAAGMVWGIGFNVFTMFPIAMCLVGGVLGLAGAKKT
ncbi:MAG TPA: hypothetical protein VLA51_13700 [Paracoccaceae bacterium]|nr:hypothetical protein [Paracoccaceae bacterium]